DLSDKALPPARRRNTARRRKCAGSTAGDCRVSARRNQTHATKKIAKTCPWFGCPKHACRARGAHRKTSRRQSPPSALRFAAARFFPKREMREMTATARVAAAGIASQPLISCGFAAFDASQSPEVHEI